VVGTVVGTGYIGGTATDVGQGATGNAMRANAAPVPRIGPHGMAVNHYYAYIEVLNGNWLAYRTGLHCAVGVDLPGRPGSRKDVTTFSFVPSSFVFAVTYFGYSSGTVTSTTGDPARTPELTTGNPWDHVVAVPISKEADAAIYAWCTARLGGSITKSGPFGAYSAAEKNCATFVVRALTFGGVSWAGYKNQDLEIPYPLGCLSNPDTPYALLDWALDFKDRIVMSGP